MLTWKPSLARSAPTLLTAMLALSAALYFSYNAWIGLDPDDSENLETPRILAAARLITAGVSGLYGPHSGSNPYVLIQAPLYYQLTAIVGWPATKFGVDPAMACLVSGRSLAFLAFLGSLWASFELARVDGGSKRAGLWSALLIAGSPIIGSYPVAMRPDMPGVMFQTIGLLLVFRLICNRRQPEGQALALRHPNHPAGQGLPYEESASKAGRNLVLAFAAFGLAACMKQHDIAGCGFASILLGIEAVKGRLRWVPLILAGAVCAAIVAISYGLGEWLTEGRMSLAVFQIPRELNQVSSGSWRHVALVGVTTLKRSIGLAILAAGCLVAGCWRGNRRLDSLLLPYIGLELALMTKMCLDSEGGWYNYAMQATICGAVLVARGLDRTVGTDPSPWRLAIVAVAALALLAANARLVWTSVAMRLEAREGLRELLESPIVAGTEANSRYFVGLAQHNRRFGRADLAHDEWLYGSYEALNAAEPRSRWLKSALTSSSIRQVVTLGDQIQVPGIPEPLAALGYEPVDRFGPYLVWERRPSGEVIVGRGAAP